MLVSRGCVRLGSTVSSRRLRVVLAQVETRKISTARPAARSAWFRLSKPSLSVLKWNQALSNATTRTISTKIELPEELDLTKREDLLKAASNLWKTMLTKPFSVISDEKDDILEILNTGVAKTILKPSDVAHLIGLFIRYLSYYHALGLSSSSQQFYIVAEKLNSLYKEMSTDRESVENIDNDLKEWKAEIEKLKWQNPSEGFRAIGKAPDPMSSCFVRFYDYVRKGTRDVQRLEQSAELFWRLGLYEEAIADLKWAAECSLKASQRLPDGTKEQKARAAEAAKFYLALAAKQFDCGRFKAAVMTFDDLAAVSGAPDFVKETSVKALQSELNELYQEEMALLPHEVGCQSIVARVELRKVDASTASSENFQRFCVDSGYAEMDNTKPKLEQSTQTHPSLIVLDKINQLNAEILKKTTSGREFPMSLILQRAQVFLQAGLHVDALRDVQVIRSKFPSLVEPAFVLSMIHSAAGMAEESRKSSSLVGKLQFYSLVRRDLQKSQQWARWLAFELKLPKPSEIVEANSFVLAHGGKPMLWLIERMISTLSSAIAQTEPKLAENPSLDQRILQLKKTLAGLYVNAALIHGHSGDWNLAAAALDKASATHAPSVPVEVAAKVTSKQFGVHDMRGFWQSLSL